MKGIYQHPEYISALKEGGEKIHSISPKFHVVERAIRVPLLGKKRILEARGSPEGDELSLFRSYCAKQKCWYGTIAPVVVEQKNKEFSSARYNKVSNQTLLLNLSLPLDSIWKNLEKKSIRWGIKTAEKSALVSTHASATDVEAFCLLYEKSAESGGFKAENKSTIAHLADSSIAHLLVIKKSDKIIAGGLILIDREHHYAILDLTAASEEGLSLQAMPFLYWELIKYAKSLGLQKFDLGGYDTHAPKGSKIARINSFKERFGAELVEQPIYTNAAKYSFIRSLMQRASFLSVMYHKE